MGGGVEGGTEEHHLVEGSQASLARPSHSGCMNVKMCAKDVTLPTVAAKIRETKLQFLINPYPTAFPYGNGMVLHFYQQQESSTTKTVHKVINKGLKTYV